MADYPSEFEVSIRFECLKLAEAICVPTDQLHNGEVVKIATAYADFCLGVTDKTVS